MKTSKNEKECGCGCTRRQFIQHTGMAIGLTSFPFIDTLASGLLSSLRKTKIGASIKTLFLYPPTKEFADNPDGWWSWPGNEFDAEARQKKYSAELLNIGQRLNANIKIDPSNIGSNNDAEQIIREIEASKPDGLFLIMFYNNSLPQVDLILEAANRLKIPAVFYIGLGVKHGSITKYQREGVYLIQSLDNFNAMESGVRMINARKLLSQSTILRITEAEGITESENTFLGTKERVIPFRIYADLFEEASIKREAIEFIDSISKNASEIRGLSDEAFENASRAYLALKRLIEQEQADGVTMNCLRRGMLKPCIGFSVLNSQLIPAACENDIAAAYGQMIGQLLTDRPGFQHNPAFETEKNHYYASHCTCPVKLYGPDQGDMKYLLRRFAHTNEGSCAIQVFWNPDDPVTMIHYYPDEDPKMDVYSGKVFVSHQMPPAGGCTTNVEIEITDRPDACHVKGHHNVLFCGDYTNMFKNFSRLHGIELMS